VFVGARRIDISSVTIGVESGSVPMGSNVRLVLQATVVPQSDLDLFQWHVLNHQRVAQSKLDWFTFFDKQAVVWLSVMALIPRNTRTIECGLGGRRGGGA